MSMSTPSVRELEQAYTSRPIVGKDATNVTTIAFVDDGLAAFGKIWYRGEELSVDRDSLSFEATCDAEGVSWLDLDEDEQIERYGRRMFRQGRWTGARFDLSATTEKGEGYTDAERKTLEELNAQAEAAVAEEPVVKRGRGRPAANK